MMTEPSSSTTPLRDASALPPNQRHSGIWRTDLVCPENSKGRCRQRPKALYAVVLQKLESKTTLKAPLTGDTAGHASNGFALFGLNGSTSGVTSFCPTQSRK